MRIAVVTVHRALNCGAALQAWALKCALERFGHSVEFPACNDIGMEDPDAQPFHPNPRKRGFGHWHDVYRVWRMNALARPIYRPALARYERFRLRNLPERDVAPGNFAAHYDLAVFGSDQIWNPEVTKGATGLFCGETLPTGFRAIAYAASVGDRPLVGQDLARVQASLGRFAAVSVRERMAADLLTPACAIPPRVTVDPTLLLKAEDYRPIAADRHPRKPYLYVYSLIFRKEFWQMAKTAAARLGLEPVYTPLYKYTSYRMPSGLVYGVSPDMFVDLIAHASCVLTDSFHGTVFSLLHHKPFASISHVPDVSLSRPAQLLSEIGCADRVVGEVISDRKLAELLSHPFSTEVDAHLDEQRSKSLDWLKTALHKAPV